MKSTVRRVRSRPIYNGKIVSLREDTVVLPRGTEAIYEYVEIKAGASVLAMEDNGDVWLVREWKYAIDRPSLEVVSGGIEPGEAAIAAAMRELREEAGLVAKEWIPMGVVDPFTTMLSCPTSLFLARGLERVEREPEEAEEFMEVLRMPLSEALSLIDSGVITHGASCVLIFKAAANQARHHSV